MTLEEWAALDEDVEGELVDGMLEEEEMPTFLHELVVMWLAAALRSWARRRRGFVVGSKAKLAVGPRRGRKPDLSLFLPGALRHGLDAAGGLERLDLLGQLGNGRTFLASRLVRRVGKPGLELVAKGCQFGEVPVMEEGLAESLPVISQLRFGDSKVLPNACAFGPVAAGQAVQCVQDGTGPLMVPEEPRLAGCSAFEVHVRRKLRVQDKAEA